MSKTSGSDELPNFSDRTVSSSSLFLSAATFDPSTQAMVAAWLFLPADLSSGHTASAVVFPEPVGAVRSVTAWCSEIRSISLWRFVSVAGIRGRGRLARFSLVVNVINGHTLSDETRLKRRCVILLSQVRQQNSRTRWV